MVQREILRLLASALSRADLGAYERELILEHPALNEHGDYASSIAMKIAARARTSPLEIARTVVAHIPQSPLVAKAEAVPPGFVNIWLSDHFLWEEVGRILQKKERYGAQERTQRERILVEHTQVNPNKQPHVGHLRNTCIGDALTRLYRFMGYSTKALYYQNDLGQQVASIVLAAQKQFVGREAYPALAAWATVAYTDIEKRMEEDCALQEEKERIQLRIAARDTPEASHALAITNEILRDTLRILSSLEVAYDLVVRESDIVKHKLWEKTFELLKTNKAFYQATQGEKKGCWLVKMPAGEDKIIVRSNGIPTYVGNDIANHLWKFGILEDFLYTPLPWNTQPSALYITSTHEGEKRSDFSGADRVVNIIDHTQSYPQQSVVESLKALGFEREAAHYHHVNYGFVYLSARTARELGIALPEDARQVKISGRMGTVVSIIDFLTKMENVLKERYGAFSTIREVRNGAIKFEMLKYNTYQDVVFDLDAALDMKGFSGPYIQYAYTRAQSVLEKAEPLRYEWTPKHESLKEENELLRMMCRFPEVVRLALQEHGPHYLCTYLFELAQLFHGFYEKNRIIGSPKERERLLISAAYTHIIKNGLTLLGIPAPSYM